MGASRWRARFLRLSPDEATFARRGFAASPARPHLERCGRSFVAGFNHALETDDPGGLGERLDEVALPERGFAYEGAGMAWTLCDLLGRGRRVPALLAGPGRRWRYLVHVGAGWAMARLRRRRPRWWDDVDPLLRWLAFDGWGFHDGYFSPAATVLRAGRAWRPGPGERRVYDQGVGRSLWFVGGAQPARIADLVGGFPPGRRPDLYSGVGLAAAYAGGASGADLAALRDGARAAGAWPQLAQGVAFAAKARLHGGNAGDATGSAVRLLCGRDVGAAARVTDDALVRIPDDGAVESYERWRAIIAASMVSLTDLS